MRRIIVFLSLLMIVCIAPRNSVSACSIAMDPHNRIGPVSGEYVFIGKVEEIVGPFQQTDYKISSFPVIGPAYGLRIRIVDPIHVPSSGTVVAEVFPYHLNPDCSISTESADFFRRVFPIGAEVRVVGKETSSVDLLAMPKKTDVERLEVSMFHFGSVSRNDIRAEFRTSALSVYDYRKFVSRNQEELGHEAAESGYYLAQFELRKDFLRLEKSLSQKDRINVLERLVYYPNSIDIIFDEIARRFVSDKRVVKNLIEKRASWLKEKNNSAG